MVLAYCAVDFPIADVVFCATMSNILRVLSGWIYPFISIAFGFAGDAYTMSRHYAYPEC